jgi:hypothetical protein
MSNITAFDIIDRLMNANDDLADACEQHRVQVDCVQAEADSYRKEVFRLTEKLDGMMLDEMPCEPVENDLIPWDAPKTGRSKHAFASYVMGNPYTSQAPRNTDSWGKIESLAAVKGSGEPMLMGELINAVEGHQAPGGARGFIIYCCKSGWLKGL